jgi:hypothetical protein
MERAPVQPIDDQTLDPTPSNPPTAELSETTHIANLTDGMSHASATLVSRKRKLDNDMVTFEVEAEVEKAEAIEKANNEVNVKIRITEELVSTTDDDKLHMVRTWTYRILTKI